MAANSITIYVGGGFSLDHEAQLKARLRRLSGPREAAGQTLIRLLVHPDPDSWITALDDCFPDPEMLSAFLVKMIAAHPGLSSTFREAAQKYKSEADTESDYRQRILDAVDSLDEAVPANDTITETNLEHPMFSPEAIEARLRGRLKQ